METANKDAALQCLNKAKQALNEGRAETAEKLAKKSLRLCPTEQAKGKYQPHFVSLYCRYDLN